MGVQQLSPELLRSRIPPPFYPKETPGRWGTGKTGDKQEKEGTFAFPERKSRL